MTVTHGTRNGKTIDEDEFILPQNDSNSRLVFLSLVVMSPALTLGMTVPFSGIALPQMDLSLDEESWFGSVGNIACLFGSIFTGLIIDKYGRRFSMIYSIIPSFVGWFLLAEKSASLTQLYLARVLTGFGLGACMLPFVVYAAECITINNVRIRGSIGTWLIFSMVTGGLLLYALSVVLPYNEVAFVSGCLSVLSLLMILIFIPESPVWLYRKGRRGDAELAQLRLGIRQPILQNGGILPTAGEFTGTKVEPQAFSLKSLMHHLSKVKKRSVYKPLAISIIFTFFCQCSGVYCLLAYMIDVITVYPLQLSPYLLSVVGQVIQIFGCVLLTFTLPYCGVKVLSIVSFLGASIGHIVLGLSLSLENPSSPNIFNYLHIISIWAIMLAGQFGIFSIPYMILGEIFPTEAKSYASITLFMDNIFSFTVLKIFPYLLDEHKATVFFMFGGICACGAVFVVYCLPETVGKTMDDIEKSFEVY